MSTSATSISKWPTSSGRSSSLRCARLRAAAAHGRGGGLRLGRGYHHHLGLNTWHSKGAPPAPVRAAGLFHVAIRYPDRRSLADALRRLSRAGIQLEGASDHGVSEALYLSDPDGNGIELYRDRPREQWPRSPGGEDVAMATAPLDFRDLLAELDEHPIDPRL